MGYLVNHSVVSFKLGRERPEREEAKAMSAWKTYWVEKTVEQDRLVYFEFS